MTLEEYFQHDSELASQQDALAKRMADMALTRQTGIDSDEIQDLFRLQKELCDKRSVLIDKLHNS